MADYISREAAVEALRPYKVDPFKIGFLEDTIFGFADGIDTAISELSVMPAADVVEVVRCKDCELMCHDEHGYWCINDYQACLDPEKDYCSRAERRAGNG